jgi:hypothetical protein
MFVFFHDDFTLGLVATLGKCQNRQQGSVCDIHSGFEAIVGLTSCSRPAGVSPVR